MGTTLSVGSRKGGVDTLVPSSVWNGTPLYALDTNIHRYEITIVGGDAFFWIDGQIVHAMNNAISTVRVNQRSQFLTVESVNSGALTNETIVLSAVSVERRGERNANPQYRRINAASTTVLKAAPGTLHGIVINNATGAFTIFDSLSGAGTVINSSVLGVNTSVPAILAQETDFSIGLTIVTTGACDVTLLWE